MKKISLNDYTYFAMDYAGGFFDHQRFGQAFMNYFYNNTTLTDPDLFYSECREECVAIIFKNYIELN